MSSFASRWAERVRRALTPRHELVLDMRFDLRSGQLICSATRVSHKARARYLADHVLLPKGVATLSEETLAGMVGTAEQTNSASDWRQALLHLAHHESEHASKILEGLETRVPRKLHDYWELAYAESVGWLGLEYVRDLDGVAHILPAGTIFSDEESAEEHPLN